MRNLAIFLTSAALGAGLTFSCSTPTSTVARSRAPVRAPASGDRCVIPGNKGAPKLNAKDPSFSYCGQYIDSDCQLGDLGKSIQEYFGPSGLETYVGSPPEGVATYCPNYSKLDWQTRQRFWIYLLMTLGYEEGGCGEPSVVQAVRNYYEKYKGTKLASLAPADSTYALPWKTSDRQSRPEVCRDDRIAADADLLKDPVYPGVRGCTSCLGPSKVAGMRAATRCTMAILSSQFQKSGQLVYRKGYFQKLTRPSTLTTRLAGFGPCTGKIEASSIHSIEEKPSLEFRNESRTDFDLNTPHETRGAQ